jgi:HTH-type transcriptional regulator/antitoxin HigA
MTSTSIDFFLQEYKNNYSKLLAAIQPKRILTEEENKKFLFTVDKLMSLGDNLTEDQSLLLELLVVIIEEFEDRQNYNLESAKPHEILKELMLEHQLKQKDLLPIFKSKGITSEVVNGKRSISKAKAKALGEFFKVSADVFI